MIVGELAQLWRRGGWIWLETGYCVLLFLVLRAVAQKPQMLYASVKPVGLALWLLYPDRRRCVTAPQTLPQVSESSNKIRLTQNLVLKYNFPRREVAVGGEVSRGLRSVEEDLEDGVMSWKGDRRL